MGEQGFVLTAILLPPLSSAITKPHFKPDTFMKQVLSRSIKTSVLCFSFVLLSGVARAAIEGVTMPPDDGKLRVICFGAHPDDCEIQASGTATMWAEKGHHVLFVSVTNGDIGHWREAGGPLALRRRREVDQAHKLLGIQGVILDIHDGELLPTVENRRLLTRLIREWKADVVMGHRPNDYHPDHRYTGVLVQDAAYMVTVPFFCPDIAPLQKNPAFFYYPDRFEKPNPFKPDVIVSVDSVMEKKLDALAIMESQFFEGGANGSPKLISGDPAKRKQAVRDGFTKRQQSLTERFKGKLSDWYSKDKAASVKHVEAFEICEYGDQPNKTELKRLFPFFE
jgi:N-acetylglucosamine malate deacetylase 1